MSDEAALLRAVIEEPEDDLPRLAYADWLDEHGQARRAEFIRLQCRLAAMDELDPQWPDLHDREWELLAVYQKRWWPPAAGPVFTDDGSDFVRGFLGRGSYSAGYLLEKGEAIYREMPLEHLRIHELQGRLVEIAGRPWLAGVTSLDLSGETITGDELRALTASPHLGRLRRLQLYEVTLPAAAHELLSRWPVVRRLTHFALSHATPSTPRPDWLRVLLESPLTEGLMSLSLGRPLSPADLSLLLSTPRLAALTQLTFGGGLTADDVRLVAGATGLPALRQLSVAWTGLGDAGNAALLASPLLARLESLDLSNTTFGPLAAAALAGSPHLGRLRRLILRQSRVGPEQARAIGRARFGALTELDLFNDKIGPAEMAALTRSPHLAGLTNLDLMSNEVGEKGAVALARSPMLPNLRSLDLSRNWIGPDGAKALIGAPLPRLRRLALGCNRLGARGCRALMLSGNLAGLWTLDLTYDTFTDATAKAVAAATPLGQLRRLGVGDARAPSKEGWRALASSPRLPHLLWLARDPFSERYRWVSDEVLEQGKGREL